MRILLVKACEYCVQQINGRQTLIGIFDNVVSPSMPIDHPPFFVVVQAEFEPDEAGQDFQMVVLMINEDGKRILELPVQGVVPTDPNQGVSRIFVSFHVPVIRFESTGNYRIDVMVNGKKEAEERIPVLVAPPMIS